MSQAIEFLESASKVTVIQLFAGFLRVIQGPVSDHQPIGVVREKAESLREIS